MNNSIRDISWAAGIFEGEGCITVTRDVRGKRIYKSLKLNVGMTDRDVVQDFAEIMGVGNVTTQTSPSQVSSNRKPLYTWQCTAKKARQAVALLLPYLSPRRVARLLAAFEEIEAARLANAERG